MLFRHLKDSLDLLVEELAVFENAKHITLGEPVLNQIVSIGNKKVRYYWDYVGETLSWKSFKSVKPDKNYLSKEIFPFPHQPSYIKTLFYKKYFKEYCGYVEKKI